MTRTHYRSIAISLCCVVLLAACAPESDPPSAASAPAEPADAALTVTLDTAGQKRLGIETAPLASSALRPMTSGTAIVLDGATLAAALDDVSAAREEADAARENFERLNRLYRDGGNASLQALETARSASGAAHARLTAAESRARADWGGQLVDAHDAGAIALRERLASRRAALLRAEFPGALPADPATLHYSIENPGANPPGFDAQFVGVSQAPTLSTNGAAVTLAAQATSAGALPRPGARLPVTASAADGPTRPLVPESAAIADGGQLWCYVVRAADRFERVPLLADERVGAAYPAADLKDGDLVVTRGAPLLLSLERGAGAGSAPDAE